VRKSRRSATKRSDRKVTYVRASEVSVGSGRASNPVGSGSEGSGSLSGSPQVPSWFSSNSDICSPLKVDWLALCLLNCSVSGMVGLSNAVVSGLRVAGPVCFLGMQGGSVLTARGILEDKSVGQLSPLPFVSLLTNCIIWSFYGLLRKDSTVLVPNAIGIVSGLGCVLAYQKHATSFPTTLYAGASLIVLVSTLLAFVGNYNLIGSIGCGLAVVVMGSPLATLKTVIQSRSTAALPFPTSFMGFCNSLSWSAYGLLVANDVMIYGPNLVGLFLSSIQMLLFAVFGLPPSRAALPKSVF